MSGKTRQQSLERLERDGLVERAQDGGYATTSRWQAALRRSLARLVAQGEQDGDIRVPVALALVEFYKDQATDEELAERVLVLAELESKSLRPSPATG